MYRSAIATVTLRNKSAPNSLVYNDKLFLAHTSAGWLDFADGCWVWLCSAPGLSSVHVCPAPLTGDQWVPEEHSRGGGRSARQQAQPGERLFGLCVSPTGILAKACQRAKPGVQRWGSSPPTVRVQGFSVLAPRTVLAAWAAGRVLGCSSASLVPHTRCQQHHSPRVTTKNISR